MGSQRIRIGLFGAALLAAVVPLLLLLRPRLGPLHHAVAALRGRAADTAHPGAARALDVAVRERTHLTDGPNLAGGRRPFPTSQAREQAVFLAYQGAVHTGNPVGENKEITAALRGRNKLSEFCIPSCRLPGSQCQG